MNRRALLRSGGLLAAGALAGCLGAGTGDGDETTDRSPTPDPSPTATPDPSPTPTGTAGGSRLVDRSFEVRNADCGTDRDAAAASADGDRVTVTGTITGSDTCHTARLADAAYDADGGRLRVAVESYLPESTATLACAECLVEIDYRATFAFEGGRPATVAVVHDGKEVASVSLDG